MSFLRRHRALLLAISGGAAFALTSPPTDLYPAVVVGLALLAASIADTPAPTFWRAFGRAAAWGTAAGIVGLRFVPAVIQRFTPLGSVASYVALVLLAAGQSLIWAIGMGVAALLRRRARAPLELSFAAGVFVALSLPTIFAWSPAGLVSPWPAFVQLADLVGERGVSVLFAVGAALVARAALAFAEHRRPTRAAIVPAAAAAALFVALPIHGALRIRGVAADAASLPTARIGLVDQAVDPLARWDPKNHAAILRTLRELTQRLEADGVELTVWPEAAYPYPLDHEARHAPAKGVRAILGGGVRGPLLIGLITHARPVTLASGEIERNSYNSATIVATDGALQTPYDKLQLLWFGEMVPGGAQLPWLRRIFQKSGGLIPGVEPRALEIALRPDEAGPMLRMAVLNCYEDTLPDVGRLVTTALGPNLLVNITNDAWFHDTAEPELHARLAAMRAIEMRLDLVRAVNLGVASWVDATGTERARYTASTPGTLIATPAIRADSPTVYARLGDKPVLVLLVAAIGYFAWRRRSALGAPPGRGATEPDAAPPAQEDVRPADP